MMMRVVMKPTPPVSVGDSVCDNPREALRMGGCPYYDYFTHNSVWFRGLMELREQTVAATEHYSFDPHKAQPRRLRTLSEVSQESRSKPGLEGQIKGRWPALNPPLESNPSETPRKARMAAPSPPPAPLSAVLSQDCRHHLGPWAQRQCQPWGTKGLSAHEQLSFVPRSAQAVSVVTGLPSHYVNG